jgi:hypothetical protein
MPKLGATCDFEEHENEVSATSNTEFSRKGLNCDVLVFGVTGATNIDSKTRIHHHG